MNAKLISYTRLMRFHKPIGIYLLLWPTLWALWLASGGLPDFKILAVFIAGVVVMRSAGCVINDFADRKFDVHVERTKVRPLASGQLSAKEAIGLFLVLAIIAVFLAFQLNFLAVELAAVGFLLTIIYPFLKRFFHLPQLILGVAFAWCVPMAFAAVQNIIPPQAWVLFLIAMIWPYPLKSWFNKI